MARPPSGTDKKLKKAGRALLAESIPPMRWLALAIIVLGVGLQTLTAPASAKGAPRTAESGAKRP